MRGRPGGEWHSRSLSYALVFYEILAILLNDR
jgi:hypothetical protein